MATKRLPRVNRSSCGAANGLALSRSALRVIIVQGVAAQCGWLGRWTPGPRLLRCARNDHAPQALTGSGGYVFARGVFQGADAQGIKVAFFDGVRASCQRRRVVVDADVASGEAVALSGGEEDAEACHLRHGVAGGRVVAQRVEPLYEL